MGPRGQRKASSAELRRIYGPSVPGTLLPLKRGNPAVTQRGTGILLLCPDHPSGDSSGARPHRGQSGRGGRSRKNRFADCLYTWLLRKTSGPSLLTPPLPRHSSPGTPVGSLAPLRPRVTPGSLTSISSQLPGPAASPSSPEIRSPSSFRRTPSSDPRFPHLTIISPPRFQCFPLYLTL